MEKNGKRRGVRCKNDDLGDASVQSLGCFVRAFFELAVMRGLLHDIEDFLRECCVGDGPG